MSKVVTATEAVRRLDLLDRVRYRRETILIRRGNEVVGRLMPPEPTGGTTLRALAEDLARRDLPDESFADDLEAVTNAQPTQPDDPWRS